MAASKISKPEIDYVDGVPIVPNVGPVLVLKGSDYEMGYQYEQQVYDVFGKWALERIAMDFTDEQELAAKAYHEQLLTYAPDFVDLLRGMAAAAKDLGYDYDYKTFLTAFCSTMSHAGRVALPTYPGTESEECKDLSFDCSGFAAWGSATKDGKLICSGSADHVVECSFLIVCYPEIGNKMIVRMALEPVSLGMFSSMNDKGVSYVHHGSGTLGNEKPGYGVFGVAQVWHTLHFANTAEEAIQMTLDYPEGTRADGMWVDTSGNAGVVECRYPATVRRSGDYGEEDFIHATNNCVSKSLEPVLKNPFGWDLSYIEHGGWNTDDMNSVRRNLCMWNALHNYHGEIDLEFVKMIWRMAGPEPEYDSIEKAEAALFPSHAKGWMPYIGNLANIMITIALPDDGNAGKYYVCTGTAVRGGEPLTGEWHFYNADQLYTFYELSLADGPQATVMAAKKRSQYDLYYANKELRKLTYHDAAYAPLSRVFDDAAIESQKGDFYLGLAAQMETAEQMRFAGKALRSFTRCQALAKHVFESLVPQATTPTALGLKEWMGDWGEWETGPECG